MLYLLCDKIYTLDAEGGTKYDDAFREAIEWFNGQSAQYGTAQGYENLTYFLTDGEPTFHGFTNESRGGWFGGQYSWPRGGGNTVDWESFNKGHDKYLELAANSKVHAIGIGSEVREDILKFFDNTDTVGTDSITISRTNNLNGGIISAGTLSGAKVGQPDIVNTAEDLAAALQGGALSEDLAEVGEDTIYGGDGDDIIFGDTINTVNLPWGEDGHPGRPEALELITGMEALRLFLAKGGDPAAVTAEQIYDYIRENHELFNVEGDTYGADDTIYDGAGDDLIFGGGGDDLIIGGEGDDILYGGAGEDRIFGGDGDDLIIGGQGDDILYGGAGDDTFKWEAGDAGTTDNPARDIIMDFGLSDDDPRGNDKIDLSELLTGEETDITAYLTLEERDEGTVLLVNSHGKLQAEGHDQEILLHGVDLAQLGAGNVDEIISSLIQQGKLSDMDGFK